MDQLGCVVGEKVGWEDGVAVGDFVGCKVRSLSFRISPNTESSSKYNIFLWCCCRFKNLWWSNKPQRLWFNMSGWIGCCLFSFWVFHNGTSDWMFCFVFRLVLFNNESWWFDKTFDPLAFWLTVDKHIITITPIIGTEFQSLSIVFMGNFRFRCLIDIYI